MQKSKIIVGQKYEFWIDAGIKAVGTVTEYNGNGNVKLHLGESLVAACVVDRSKLIRRV